VLSIYVYARASERVCVGGYGCLGAGVCLRVCSITYPACNAHAPYFYLQLVWLQHVFRHYVINGTIFSKIVIGH
jgi:hypothetical protein